MRNQYVLNDYVRVLRLTTMVILVILAACAEQIAWHKDGGTPQELQMALAKCRIMFRQSQMQLPSSPGLADAIYNNQQLKDNYSDCMIAQGWFPQDASFQMPPRAIAMKECSAILPPGTTGEKFTSCVNQKLGQESPAE